MVPGPRVCESADKDACCRYIVCKRGRWYPLLPLDSSPSLIVVLSLFLSIFEVSTTDPEVHEDRLHTRIATPTPAKQSYTHFQRPWFRTKNACNYIDAEPATTKNEYEVNVRNHRTLLFSIQPTCARA